MNGQMEKEKQIEEMARDLSETYKGNDCLFTNACDICEYSKYQGNKEYPCGAMKHAKEMIVRGYRKERQGEWISELRTRLDWRGKNQQYYQPNSCSLCHEAVVERTQYCPHCGAKMKGAE